MNILCTSRYFQVQFDRSIDIPYSNYTTSYVARTHVRMLNHTKRNKKRPQTNRTCNILFKSNTKAINFVSETLSFLDEMRIDQKPLRKKKHHTLLSDSSDHYQLITRFFNGSLKFN